MKGKDGIRWTPPPDRWAPFYTKGNTHRGPSRLDAAGWYFVDGRDKLCGPFDNRVLAEVEIEAQRIAFAADPTDAFARFLSR